METTELLSLFVALGVVSNGHFRIRITMEHSFSSIEPTK